MSETRQNTQPIEHRVTALEFEMRQLTSNVDKLSHMMEANNKQFSESINILSSSIENSLNNIRIDINSMRKTDWSVVISAILLVCVIVAAIVYPINTQMQDMREDIKDIQSFNIKYNYGIQQSKTTD